MAAGTAEITEVSGDRFAQIGIAAAGGILEQMRAFPRQHSRAQMFPSLDRELVDRGERGNERNARRACDPKIELFARAVVGQLSHACGEARRSFSLRLRLRCFRTKKRFWQRVGDEGAGAGPRFEVAFGVQLFEREFHREPRDAQLGGERAGRGKTRGITVKAAGDQFVTDLTVKLLMK